LKSDVGGQKRDGKDRMEGKKGVSRRGAKAQRMIENEIGKIVIDAAIAVHRGLGPELLVLIYSDTSPQR